MVWSDAQLSWLLPVNHQEWGFAHGGVKCRVVQNSVGGNNLLQVLGVLWTKQRR